MSYHGVLVKVDETRRVLDRTNGQEIVFRG
jgi:hypothetical protein